MLTSFGFRYRTAPTLLGGGGNGSSSVPGAHCRRDRRSTSSCTWPGRHRQWSGRPACWWPPTGRSAPVRACSPPWLAPALAAPPATPPATSAGRSTSSPSIPLGRPSPASSSPSRCSCSAPAPGRSGSRASTPRRSPSTPPRCRTPAWSSAPADSPADGSSTVEGETVVAGGSYDFPDLGEDPTGAGDHPTTRRVEVSVDDPSFAEPREAVLDKVVDQARDPARVAPWGTPLSFCRSNQLAAAVAGWRCALGCGGRVPRRR
jgi:hypothetical protein